MYRSLFSHYTMMSYPLFAAVLLSFMMILNLIQRRMKLNSTSKNPPGPSGLPFIGNLHQFDKSKPHIYLWKLAEKYGPLVYLKHVSTPIILVSSQKLAKEILKTQDISFCSRPPVVGQQKLSYGGLDLAFSPYNNQWKEMRKICILHLLSSKQVLTFRPVREDEVSHMISKISNLASSSQPANLSVIAMSLASNLICRMAFGRRYDDDEYDKKRLDRLVIEAQNLMVSFFWSDHLHVPLVGNWLDTMSGLVDRIDKNFKEFDVFYQQLIHEHIDPSRPKHDREDILDLIIKLKEQNSSSLVLTWDHIKALLMNLFVAGTDTVAAATVWAMTALMLRPSIMKKAQDDIRQVMGRKGSIEEDDIKLLPYLKAVVLETLRLYPPAPLLYRKQILQSECIVDGYTIKPGTKVFINAWAIARDPETWENPNEFLPERFLNSSRTLINPEMDCMFTPSGEFSMIPFGGGRRGCPGVEMGLASIELALGNLLYAFDWGLLKTPSCNGVKSVEEALETHVLPGLTMHKKEPLVLVPTKYSYVN